MAQTLKVKEQTQLSLSRYPRRVAQVAIAFSVIALGVAFLHPFAKESSYATDSDVSVSYSGEDWVISAPTSTAADAGGLEFDIEGNPAGVNMAKKDTVTAGSTNVPNYQIYVSVDTEGGKIPNTSNADYSIAATSGTVTDATDSSKLSGADALSNNSWGYALSSFNSSINYDNLVNSSTHTDWNSSKWSKLPYIASASKDDEDTVESTAAKIYDSTTGSGGSVDIYYAVNANNDLASGEYQTTVTYTLIGEMPTPAKTYMQDVTYASWCSSLADYDPTSTATQKATTYELWDKRTNFENEYPYYIRKLADGNCWMVENLYLEGGKTLTSSDSNVSSNYDLPASSTDGFSDNTAANLFSGGRNRDGYTTTKDGTTYPADGSYMTWVLAKAGTASGKNSDVCPKNWRLPENSEYSTVAGWGYSTFDTRWFADKDGGNNSATPIYPGTYDGSALYANGSYVRWWSSTQYSANDGYYLNRNGTNLTTSSRSKRDGYSVRCMLSSS